jgi:16S rRNA (cytosine967-C5)-methyltransferase
MASSPRAAAARTLAGTLNGRSVDDGLPAALESVPARDRGLVRQLCYGTLRSYPLLAGILDQMLERPLKRRDADIRALLLLGGYQLLYLRTPDHAAISTTVEACRELQKPWATRLVNGVLRRWGREQDTLREGLEPCQLDAHPAWLYQALQETWPDQFRQIIAANNSQPPMTLRVNLARVGREEYLAQLAQAGLQAEACEGLSSAVRLASPADVLDLPGFSDGLVSVQDAAAQWAAVLLDPGPGDRVLDACAAPGGKACHLLEQQPDLAELVAMDSDAGRLDKVRDNLQRLGLQATVLTADASAAPKAPGATSFDCVLVDAPCSGTGVIRRHPDIKLLRRPGDIEKFAATQLAILQGAWKLLRNGGRLLYVTCSVLPRENQEVVEHFLALTGDARSLPLPAGFGISAGAGRQLLPEPDGDDGLFYALLGKD